MALADPGGGGGSVVGIDPQLLAALIQSLTQQSGDAQSLVNSYLAQVSRCGLDTSRLTSAARDLAWAQDQLPMLNRRQSMAQALEQQDPSLGPMVPAGAGYLDFPTNQAAQQAGQADGAKALQALQDRSSTDFILNALGQYGNDPAYLAAFFKALGPQGLAQLGLQVNGYQQQGHNDQYQLWSSTVGTALATASYQLPFSADWFSQLHLPEDGATQPQLDLIQPFLQHGVYSSAWLNPLGQYALQQARLEALEPGGMMPPPQLDGIWTAIAHNPSFDAQFYQQNFTNKDPNANYPPTISYLMTNPMLQHSVVDSAFASMVQAATIPPDPAQFPGLDAASFARNAQATIQYFGQDPSLETSGAVRQVFANVAMYYFTDLRNSVGAAAPGIGGKNLPGWQVTASESDWAAFVQQAMGDPTAAARLLTFYGEWRQQYPDSLGPWQDESFRLMDLFMLHQYQAAGSKAGKDSGSITKYLIEGGAAFLTGLVFPEADVATAGALLTGAITEGVKDSFKAGAANALDSAFGGDGSELQQPPSQIQTELDQITKANDNWSRIVRTWYNNEGGRPSGPVTFNGQTTNGDPARFINEYGGFSGPGNANFFDANGQLMDPSTMTPAQLAAYNAWLQDPAIAESAVPGTSVPGAGPKRLWQTFQQQLPGGNQ